LFLRGEVAADPVAAGTSPEGQEFSVRAVRAWTAVIASSGTASTDEIAAAAAERAGASLYAVVQPPDLRWHIPSKLVSPDHSPALAAFLEHVDAVVAVHGFGRSGMFTSLLLGGRDRARAEWLASFLAPALPEYDVVAELGRIPISLRGQHPHNPVNLVAGGGVQLELPPRVRGIGPFWDGWPSEGRRPHTEALIDALAAAAASAAP
ncbi:MAG TPA: poly-gamma-glutamate hydrolase family protein, partial [Acidimicrobiales bacterium]|nr:poly-gamma-glutamate hydrolase family protein [Acidimicrobiales bacterium]